MHNPRVSVLIPLYNHEKYIAETIESVLAQTWSDFECLIMDDGSTDASLAIAQRYEKKDSRVRVLSQQNTGLVGALNALAEQARGEFTTTLDADDAFFPERLETGVAKLTAEPDLAVSFCSTQVVDAEGKPSTMRAELLRGPLKGRVFLEKLVVNNLVASCAGMIRAECLRKTRPFARNFSQVPDWDLWLRLSAFGALELSQDIQVRVRWDGNNMSSKNIALSYRQHYWVSKEWSDSIIAREQLGSGVQQEVYRTRSRYAFCISDFVSAARELLLKRKISPLGIEESFTLLSCLVSMGKLSVAAQMLIEMSKDEKFQSPKIQTKIHRSLTQIQAHLSERKKETFSAMVND